MIGWIEDIQKEIEEEEKQEIKSDEKIDALKVLMKDKEERVLPDLKNE